jgi:hypothetical protein
MAKKESSATAADDAEQQDEKEARPVKFLGGHRIFYQLGS